jgi:hypothetical protein
MHYSNEFAGRGFLPVGLLPSRYLVLQGSRVLPCCFLSFPQDEVDRMVNEADRFADEDKAKRKAVETKNNAESMVYQTEKQIKELGDKVGGGGSPSCGVFCQIIPIWE